MAVAALVDEVLVDDVDEVDLTLVDVVDEAGVTGVVVVGAPAVRTATAPCIEEWILQW